MNYFKRAIASVSRKPGKTVILLLLVFVLGNVIAGAISIRTAVLNTDANLRANLPAIATISMDWDAWQAAWNRGEEPEWEEVTADQIREVANLPYVENFNMTFDFQIQASELQRYWNPITPEEQDWVDEDWDNTIEQGADFQSFEIRGIMSPEIFEVQNGLMELVAGRLFTEEEINSGENVAIISRGFAEENNLQIGSIMPFYYNVVDQNIWMDGGSWLDELMEENLLAQQEAPLEVVGIIDIVGELEGEPWVANRNKARLENRITVPLATAETGIDFLIQTMLQYQPEQVEGIDPDDFMESLPFQSMFQLSDPAYLEAFAEVANEILPGFNIIVDLSNTFGDIAGSMETMLMIADIVLWVSVGSTLVILSLLITLFLRDRKHEIGIYIALGERKGRVVSQILIEVMSTAIVAVALSLFTGSILSSGISQQMLENDLRQRQEDSWMGGGGWSSGDMELAMFSPGEMTFEEMLAAYDTSLDGTTVILFFGVATATILVSTLAPILYVMRLNPKKIMM